MDQTVDPVVQEVVVRIVVVPELVTKEVILLSKVRLVELEYPDVAELMARLVADTAV